MPYNADGLNRLQIREQQELNRQRRMQEEAEKRQRAGAVARAKAPYDHVRPQVFARPPAPARVENSKDDVQIRVYVRECDGAAAQAFTFRESAPLAAQSEPTREEASAGVASSPVFAPGQVPKYLQKRKAELLAEKQALQDEAQRRRELAKIPPGSRLVSDLEKAETLERLAARQKELEVQLSKIPIRFDTHAIKMRRRNIEEELAQIEADKVKYNHKKPLYLPIN